MQWYLKVLRNYATFSGRARRKEFWMFALFNMIFAFILGLIDAIANTGNVLAIIYNLAVIIPNIAVTVRRLHDTDRSGWWWFIALIPLIGAIVLLIFMVLDSSPHDNEYGPYPKHTM